MKDRGSHVNDHDFCLVIVVSVPEACTDGVVGLFEVR